MIDLSIWGSKTDTTLAGQAAVLTAAPDAAGDGVRAFLDGTPLELERSPPTHSGRWRPGSGPTAPRRRSGGASPSSTRGRRISAPSRPRSTGWGCRCTASPVTGSGSTLGLTPRRTCASKCASRSRRDGDVSLSQRQTPPELPGPRARHIVTDGIGASSFRWGRAMELLHGGTPREDVSEVLRHRSAARASTRPYIADSVRLA